MNFTTLNPNCPNPDRARGMTLVEMVITLAVSSILLTVVMSLFMFALRSFGAMSNYTQMDSKSQQAVDLMLREIRESNLVVGYQTNGASTWLKVANTNASPALTNTFTWTRSTGLLTWDQTGEATRTLLSGCNHWSFAFYIRVAASNGVFYPTTDAASCKLINMTWNCSRDNIAKNINTESIVTAEVVLRNKQ